jgi:hypothetical protein
MLSKAQLERNRRGGHALHQPMNLALRLARAWSEVEERERPIIAAALRPLLPTLAHAGDLGDGRCDRCHQMAESLFYAENLDKVCPACVGR